MKKSFRIAIIAALSIVASVQHGFSETETNLIVTGTTFYGATQVPSDLGKVWDINAGGIFVYTLLDENTPRGWSSGTPFFFETGQSLENVVDIEVGEESALALHSDGSITSWDYYEIKLDVPTRALNPLLISSGGEFAMILSRDGSVETWGENSHGQLNVPANMGRVVQIDAGINHAVALNSEGKAWSWGFGVTGELPTPEGAGRIVHVAAGLHDTIAVTEFGKVLAWDASKNIYEAPDSFENIVFASTGSIGNDRIGLKADGTVLIWNSSNRGIENLESESGVVAIDIYRYVAMALKQTGNEIHKLDIINRSEGDYVSTYPLKTEFDNGERVTITAFPPTGMYLSHWNGANGEYSNPLVLTMIQDKEITPVYKRYSASKPTATPSELNNSNELDLTLTTITQEAAVYYTLDGTDPTKNSTRYTGPVSISDLQLLKAIAIKENYNDSTILEYTYQTVDIKSTDIVRNETESIYHINFQTKSEMLYSLLHYKGEETWEEIETNFQGTGEIEYFEAILGNEESKLFRISARR